MLGDSARVRVVCSPYVRTRETLSGVAAGWDRLRHAPTAIEPRVAEMDVSGGLPMEDATFRHANVKSRSNPYFFRWPNGESWADLERRTLDYCAADGLLVPRATSTSAAHEAAAPETVVIITHALAAMTLMRSLSRRVARYRGRVHAPLPEELRARRTRARRERPASCVASSRATMARRRATLAYPLRMSGTSISRCGYPARTRRRYGRRRARARRDRDRRRRRAPTRAIRVFIFLRMCAARAASVSLLAAPAPQLSLRHFGVFTRPVFVFASPHGHPGAQWWPPSFTLPRTNWL